MLNQPLKKLHKPPSAPRVNILHICISFNQLTEANLNNLNGEKNLLIMIEGPIYLQFIILCIFPQGYKDRNWEFNGYSFTMDIGLVDIRQCKICRQFNDNWDLINWSVRAFSRRKEDGVKGVDWGIVIYFSQLRADENLMYHPNKNISISLALHIKRFI